ncbi:hypothetical protein [Pseudomonas sp. B26(2017)]|uniref:hypothetical protein n=1 Tax=Pseudomonas sp. B26(2017) TaxID=1981732 RepID=UPI000A1ED3A5|nr:hypothetical protein [Pseudomonas sp. B26(2017)]
MKSSFFKAGFVAALALSAQGCASIISTSKPVVGVYANSPDTTYSITDVAGKLIVTGQTPAQVPLNAGRGYFKRQSYIVKFHHDGYSDDVRNVDASVNGWYWANLLFGGLVGLFVVDPLTGAMYTLPDEVNGNLVQLAHAPPSSTSTVTN